MKSFNKRFLFTWLFVFVTVFLFSQTEKYSRVKIYTDAAGLKRLSGAGVAIDHGECKKGMYFISDFSSEEVGIIKTSGIKYDILIDDVVEHYVQQNSTTTQKVAATVSNNTCSKIPSFATPANFALGSMGGFFTYAEIIANIDTMLAKYPNLISAKSPISTTKTIQGRDIYWVRISNNPTVDQNKPEVLYTALHHAREPASASQVIMYMYYLLENYATDSMVKYLVDNTEMYFVPCINPDGYIYNQQTNPNGGGLFRKNRRNNGDGTYGVDLNRNYGYQWGYDNFGSSNQTNNDAYRGTAAFSEPETQAMKDFCNAHQFKLAINYHTFSNDLIYPWGYGTSLMTNDSITFRDYAKIMTAENGYTTGTPDETVGYTANGGSDDWMYGEQSSKPKIISMSAEAGSAADGFWPAQSRIVDVCKENLAQNIHMAQLATKYAAAKELSPTIVTQLSDYAVFNIQRMGLDSPGTYTVSLIPVSSNITGVGSAKTYSSLKLFEQQTDSISYSLSSSIVQGDKISFVLSVSNGSYSTNDTITKVYGNTIAVYSNNGNSISGWSAAHWGISSTVYHSPSSSITDSPLGNYANNADYVLQKTSAIDLTDAVYAELDFWARWQVEEGYDFVEVSASSDNGSTWTPLCGKYTKSGNDNQDPGAPVYDGYQYSWVQESMNLSDFIGKNILLKFELISDAGVNYDGFYFDDLNVLKIVPSLTGINEVAKSGIILGQNIPNPGNGNTIIPYMLKDADTDLFIYDALGNIVEQKKLSKDVSQINIDLSNVSDGVYYYRIQSSTERSDVKRMMVVK